MQRSLTATAHDSSKSPVCTAKWGNAFAGEPVASSESYTLVTLLSPSWGTLLSVTLSRKSPGYSRIIRRRRFKEPPSSVPPHDTLFPYYTLYAIVESNLRTEVATTACRLLLLPNGPIAGLAVAATRRPVKPLLKAQLLAVDHSARVSMKSAASCVN